MKRIVITDPFPHPPVQADRVVVTPHPAAAAAANVPYRDLRRFAEAALAVSGKRVAPEMRARKALHDAVSSVLPKADPSAIASRIGEILSTVLRTGTNLDVLTANGSRRVQELSQIASRYVAELDRLGLIDQSTLMLAAAEHVQARPGLIIYGYHRSRPEEIRFINALAGDGSRLYLPIANGADFAVNREWLTFLISEGWTEERTIEGSDTASIGTQAARRFIDSEAKAPAAEAFAYQNIDDEVRGVLARVKALAVEGTALSRVAIVCEDLDEYAYPVAAVACEYGLPVEISHSVPVGQTTLGGLLRLILDAAGSELEFESCVRLLQHRLGPGLEDGKWNDARRTRPGNLYAWDGLGVALGCLAWPEEQRIEEWCKALRNCLSEFDVRQNCAPNARDLVAYYRFLDSLAELNGVEGKLKRSREYFIATVSDLLSSFMTPFSPAKGGVRLHSTKTIVGAKFDHVFILGMAEGVLPPTVSENPVVDFFERGKLAEAGIRFESAADVARWDRLAFYFALLSARSSIAFSYPESIDGKEKIASSYFERLGIKPVKPRAEDRVPSSIEEMRRFLIARRETTGDDQVLDGARERYAIELSREISPTYDEYDGITGIPIDPNSRLWSVSQLTAIGQCPFKWFAGRVLRLAPPDELATDLDPAARGNLYHKVLELAVVRSLGAADIRSAVLDVLDDCFLEAESAEDITLPVRLNWDVEREEHLRHIRKAVMAPDFIREGARVLSTEEEYQGEWKGFRLSGYIDRIDETPDGLIAIDYKTSSAVPKGVKDEAGKLSIDIQLPIYTHVALGKLYPGKPLGKGAYYSLTKGKTLKEVDNVYPAELDGFAERAASILEKGAFAVEPDAERRSCEYCDLKSVCREGTRLDHKSGNE